MVEARFLMGLPFATCKINKQSVECLVDTGFNGSILLSNEIIHELNLSKVGIVSYVTADARGVAADIYHAHVDWFGKIRQVEVICGEGDFALLGMELLFHARTTIDPSCNILSISPSAI